jgi:hypothetical protein
VKTNKKKQMKRILSLLLITSATGVSYAQMVNGSTIHVSEGAVMTVNTPMTNTGTVTNKGRVHLKSDLKNDAKFQSTGDLMIDGDMKQVISGSQSVELSKVTIENNVNLQTEMKVSNEVNFVNGVVTADKPLHFEKDAKATGASDFSHVVGTVQKTGDQSFQFPLGDGSNLKSFEAANPKQGTLEASYVSKSPLDISSELDISLANINETEYWTLKSTGSDKVKVNLTGGEDVAALTNGVWTKQDKSLNTENGSKFTSGKGSYLQKEIGVWPNPTQGEFNLKLSGMRDSDNISIDITNQDGRVVMKMDGTVKNLRKAYKLPSGLVTTNLTIRVINGDEALTQNLILHK